VLGELVPDFLRRWMRNPILIALAPVLLFPMARAQSSLYLKDFVRATVTPETLLAPAATGAFSNYVTKPAGFGSGAEGFGYHFGVALADNVSGKFLRKVAFAAPARHQDYYCPLGSAVPLPQRLLNVVLHSVFNVPQTSRVFNWSALPASLAGAALSTLYQPDQQRTASAVFTRFGTNAAGYMVGDLLSELTFKPKPSVAIHLVIGPR
jgi:hypothetical protein